MRGMYTAGALDVFLKEGVHFQGVMGVSAGALFGVNFLSGQAGRVIRYCKKYNPDHHYMGLGVLLHTGEFVNRHFAYDKVPRELDPFDDQAFQASGVPFYAVVTNLDTGNAEYLPIHSVFAEMDVLRASGSMPFFAQPVPWQGRRYLDGGVADSIPYEAMGRLGYDRRVVILTPGPGISQKAHAPGGGQGHVRKISSLLPAAAEPAHGLQCQRGPARRPGKGRGNLRASALAAHYRAPAGAGSGGAAGGLRPGGKGRARARLAALKDYLSK